MTTKIVYSGTGHRPQFLPCKFDENHIWLQRCMKNLDDWLAQHLHEIDYVITGGAIGWDTWLAEHCYKLNIPFKVYVPFKEQGQNWPRVAQQRYKEVLSYAKEVVYICDKYSKQVFLIRDEQMVDHSSYVLALWNPAHKSGGTYHTVSYAESKGKPIINFWKD